MRFHPRELCVFGPYFCTSLIWPRPRGEKGNCSYPFPLSHRVKQTNNIKNIKDITCSVIGGNHRNPVDSHYKWSVIRKVFFTPSSTFKFVVTIGTRDCRNSNPWCCRIWSISVCGKCFWNNHFQSGFQPFQNLNTTVSNALSWMKTTVFWFKFHLSLLPRALISISSDNGLASNRQETITRTNDDPVPWYVSQAQRARSAIITSLCRQNDVATSF